MSVRACGWILTINNPEQSIEEMKEYIENLKGLEYAIFQLEQGESGTPHFQIYLEFKNQKRFETLKNQFPTAHIEKRLGTKDQARRYCMKEETRIDGPVEIGQFVPEERGKRKDLEELAEAILNGADEFEVMELYPHLYLKYRKHIKGMIEDIRYKYYARNDREKLEVIYIGGLPGVGKSYFVRSLYKEEPLYVVTDYKNPFDNYKGEKAILFEEFRSNISLVNMLNYLDRYTCQLPARYNNKYACWHKVYIISNLDLSEQYSYMKKEELMPLYRRINVAMWIDIPYIIDYIYNNPDILQQMTKEVLDNAKISYKRGKYSFYEEFKKSLPF